MQVNKCKSTLNYLVIYLILKFGQMKETWSEDDEQIITLIPVNTF